MTAGATGSPSPWIAPREPRYLHDEAELFLPSVLDQAGVEQPILIGHSDGGTIALLFAARFPDLPVAVVTEAAHVFVEEITLAGIRAAGRAYAETDLATRLAPLPRRQDRAPVPCLARPLAVTGVPRLGTSRPSWRG